jgi:hypothetical protein
MRAYVFAIFAASMFAIPITTRADDNSGWENIRNEAGISVSRKAIPGSSFVALRGEGDVNGSLLAVADVLVDVAHEQEWIADIKEARVLRHVTDTEYILYSHLGTPPTLTDREFVADVKLTIDPSKQSLRIDMRSVDDPAAPSTSYVRGFLSESSFRLQANPDGKTTHVVAEIHADPKGNLPGWVVNFFQKNWGFRTLQSLRKQVASGRAPVHPLLQAKLE